MQVLVNQKKRKIIFTLCAKHGNEELTMYTTNISDVRTMLNTEKAKMNKLRTLHSFKGTSTWADRSI